MRPRRDWSEQRRAAVFQLSIFGVVFQGMENRVEQRLCSHSGMHFMALSFWNNFGNLGLCITHPAPGLTGVSRNYGPESAVVQ